MTDEIKPRLIKISKCCGEEVECLTMNVDGKDTEVPSCPICLTAPCDFEEHEAHAGGRPTVFNDLKFKKLEEACALDCSIREICFYVGISIQTYYDWKAKYPKLFERLDALRMKPILKARKAVENSLSDPDKAFQYLGAKMKDEFSAKTISKVEGDLGITESDRTLDELFKNATDEQRENLLKAIDGIQAK